MNNRNYYTITLALLGAIKLTLNSFGVDILTNGQMNDIANGVAALITVGGVIMTHLKNRTQAPQQLKQVASDIVNKEANK